MKITPDVSTINVSKVSTKENSTLVDLDDFDEVFFTETLILIEFDGSRILDLGGGEIIDLTSIDSENSCNKENKN